MSASIMIGGCQEKKEKKVEKKIEYVPVPIKQYVPVPIKMPKKMSFMDGMFDDMMGFDMMASNKSVTHVSIHQSKRPEESDRQSLADSPETQVDLPEVKGQTESGECHMKLFCNVVMYHVNM